MLTYKLEEVGIKVTVGEESYTSKSSFLDWDNIPTYTPGSNEKHTFSGKRTSRSWYVSKDGFRIPADVNGGYNIGRKVIPSAFESLNPILARDRGCLVSCSAFKSLIRIRCQDSPVRVWIFTNTQFRCLTA